jgi:hypothetical protein
MSTFSEASEIEFFNECIDNLAAELFYEDIDRQQWLRQFDSEDNIRKSAWIASILASSDDDAHRKKALAFGILAYLKYRGGSREDVYERYLYIILSRLGDLPAVENLFKGDEREGYDLAMVSSFDSVLSMELGTNLGEYAIGDGDYLSEFQSDVFEALKAGKNVAISGPTSSGKSFILQRYIDSRIEDTATFEAIYVVPTRALISEVSADLKQKHDDISVKTGVYFDNEEQEENTFLVVTPERCLKLLRDEMTENLDPSLIFFDEFQNVEDNERGILMENVIESLEEMWPDAQIVVAGPYLADPADGLRRITESDVEEITTIFTPIYQLKIVLTLWPQKGSDRKLKATIQSPTGNEVIEEIDEPDGLTISSFNQNKGDFLSTLLSAFANDSQSLVYASQRRFAENWAESIASEKAEVALSDRTMALNDFLRRAIHDDYSLIDCIEHGVAFHHRMLPKIARTEIEDIYREENDIDVIVSTPTLLQGVNLPAEKIFVHNPSKGREELTEFDFQNLIGRVGRLNENLYGSIYCVETEDDEWSEEKLTGTGNKYVKPATDRALENNTEELIEAAGAENVYEVEEKKIRYTSIILRNKHLKGGHSLDEYLGKKNVSDSDKIRIKTQLDSRLADIKIPESILRRNPTIDPVQQDKLYRSVSDSPSDWVLADNRGGFTYEDLLNITRKLNEVFLFSKDFERGINPEDSEVKQENLVPVVVTALRWLMGDSYRQMIDARQESENVDDRDVNQSIMKVMQIINDDVRFVLVKYFRILTDVLEEIDEPVNDWMLQFDQMLELGSVDSNELELMFMGVDRSVVIDLPIQPEVDDVVSYLRTNRGLIQNFYIDHLEEYDVL